MFWENVTVPKICFVEDEPDSRAIIPSKYLIPKKINLMVYALFQVAYFEKFNRKDARYPFSFYLNRGTHELSFSVLA
nr:CNT_HP1_G0046530.mRNA.1.CDS.1 [Saccharomyces cerevisiae]